MSRALTLRASLLMLSLSYPCSRSAAQEPTQARVVRLAELEIDQTQIENYKAALREEIATSIRLEPGILTLYAVALKENPTQVRIFETYADVAAYRAHLETSHFKRYKAATQGMVKSLKLLETDPIMLGAKGQ
ncbi:antibiotic biosynthesis monooxygenase [uncultured Paludibaculum sp.]|uniref:putative quinol monooxygenase n=1 Tax=uncultured Paludibaculum sp. TaxID=1765020 RepID=UPI002AAB1433|nr:antibiotic biosynthesis monooxygenase [uncultured Paludibaculum sp.]